jgi:hypothetical protein
MVTPGTPDPGTPPSTAADATKPIATDVAAPPDPGPGPGRTPLLGLNYTGDSAENANWDKIDAVLGPLQPAPVAARTPTATTTTSSRPSSSST